MKTLEELSLLDNTIVFFSSDHGDMLGSQGARLKRKPWEESIAVPGIWWNPKLIGRGRVSDAIFSHVDFAPTFLGLCGLKAPAAMQGLDHTSVITGRRKQLRDAALLQIFGPFSGDGTKAGWRGIRTATHTYARYENEPWILHDNKRDPFQMKNLAGSREHASLQASLEKRMNAMMQAHGDSWSHNWSEPVEDGGRLYKDRAYDSVAQYLQSLR
jgi:arylsulfatase A-like enzyme